MELDFGFAVAVASGVGSAHGRHVDGDGTTGEVVMLLDEGGGFGGGGGVGLLSHEGLCGGECGRVDGILGTSACVHDHAGFDDEEEHTDHSCGADGGDDEDGAAAVVGFGLWLAAVGEQTHGGAPGV